jgi:hypothetical protein
MSHSDGLDGEALVRIEKEFAANFEKERRRIDRYGYVRPIIAATFKGYRLVAVGSTLHWSQSWKTVADFLFDYIKTTLGPEWGMAEIQKPLAERHPILQWYDSLCRFQKARSSSKNAEGLSGGPKDGPTAAYCQLAYDLYVLADHLKLQNRIVERLKHPQLFQGARYELAVATHCIRAGFDIEYEDEEDKSSKHPEFIATHKETGQVIAVEAKSRHRPGVLGRPGEMQKSPRTGITRILRQARAKAQAVQRPYAVFVDLNLPPSEGAEIRELGWFQELLREIEKQDEEGQYPCNLLMFTNHPQHYGAEGAPNPGWDRVSVVSLNPKTPVAHPQALKALHDAALQYGRIPNWFEESGLAGDCA